MRFNREVVTRYMADTVWRFTAPASRISLSGPDTAAYEDDGTHTFFPHRLSDYTTARDESTLRAWMERTPTADAATLDLAQVMVTELGLGRDASVDLLTISLSQTDAVGHAFGPFSREQLDNLYRLDLRLGAFLRSSTAPSAATGTSSPSVPITVCSRLPRIPAPSPVPPPNGCRP